MRILYCGNNRVGRRLLQWLVDRGETIVAVAVHPPERSRYRDEILHLAQAARAKIIRADRLHDPDVIETLQSAGVDVGLSVFFGYLLGKPLIELPAAGFFNVHPALLPWNRGSHPNVWSIVEQTPAGATVHYVDEGIDTGDTVCQKQVPVDPADTAKTLYQKLEQACEDVFHEAWPQIRAGRAPRHPQDASKATIHKKSDLARLDEIDLSATYTGAEIVDWLRARTFPPFPPACFVRNGKRVYCSVELTDEKTLLAEKRSCGSGPGSRSSADPARPEIQIHSRKIARGRPCYIIAELSANHGQEYSRAVELVHAAAEAGANAVKLQTYTPDTMTIDCDCEHFRIGPGTIWEGRTLYDLYSEAQTPWDWQPMLKELADGLGIDLFSTPFDDTAVAFLEGMDVPAYKVASFELVDIPLIRTIARTGKPMILSTGMAGIEEIQDAVDAARQEGNDQLALLKCTSAYPASPADANLRAIATLAEQFGVISGLSDHTLEPVVPVTAVALGAAIIEKHFTLHRSDGGPDAAFSLEPDEFADMVRQVRLAEQALGEGQLARRPAEQPSTVFRRSLFVVADIREGQPLTPENVRSIRPGTGLPPKFLPEVLGRKASCDIQRGTPLQWDLLAHDGS